MLMVKQCVYHAIKKVNIGETIQNTRFVKMSKETLPERIERNKRERTREKQEAYQKGFTEGEKRAIKEFLSILEQGIHLANILLSHSNKSRKHELHNTIEDLIDECMTAFKQSMEHESNKWEERYGKK